MSLFPASRQNVVRGHSSGVIHHCLQNSSGLSRVYQSLWTNWITTYRVLEHLEDSLEVRNKWSIYWYGKPFLCQKFSLWCTGHSMAYCATLSRITLTFDQQTARVNRSSHALRASERLSISRQDWYPSRKQAIQNRKRCDRRGREPFICLVLCDWG